MKFRENLVGQLKQWREDGDWLIVCLDANKNIYRKLIGKALMHIEGLAMKEVVGELPDSRLAPHFSGGQSQLTASGQHQTSPSLTCVSCQQATALETIVCL